MLNILRRLNRVNLIKVNYLSSDKKTAAGSDYFKSIVHNVNDTVKKLDDLELDDSDVRPSREMKLNEESTNFARKVLENPNKFIENRRTNPASFIQKRTNQVKDDQGDDLENLQSKPRDWSREIQQVKEEKRAKRLYFKSQRGSGEQSNQTHTRDELNPYKFKKFEKKFEINQRKESFKEKFIEFNKKSIDSETTSTDLIELKEQENEKDDVSLMDQPKDMMPFRPVVYNLAYFVNDSVVLQKFIDMGVMIRKWDKDRQICEFVLKLDLEKNVKPHLIFLHDIQIPADKHAKVIQNNPMFFKESLEDLHTRIKYLKSKKFTDEAIIEIICKAPRWLNLSVEQVDTKLGWFQHEFSLTGNELREIVTLRPKLVTLPLKIASDVRFCLKDFLSFSDESVKHLIKTYPKLFTKDYKILEANYNYLTRVIKLTDQQIESYPPILQTPLLLIRTRYAFLKHLNRIQFDPTLPNFISIKNMVEPIESRFLEKYAKSSLDEYKKFIKTI